MVNSGEGGYSLLQGLIHHVVKSSVDFWGWLLEELGYKPIQEWDSGQSWKIRETYIVLYRQTKNLWTYLITDAG